VMDTARRKSLTLLLMPRLSQRVLRIDTEGLAPRVICSRFDRRASGRSSRSLILELLS
jgi:hypothetical protein